MILKQRAPLGTEMQARQSRVLEASQCNRTPLHATACTAHNATMRSRYAAENAMLTLNWASWGPNSQKSFNRRHCKQTSSTTPEVMRRCEGNRHYWLLVAGSGPSLLAPVLAEPPSRHPFAATRQAHPTSRRQLCHLGMLCNTYINIRLLVLPNSRATKQLTRIAVDWVVAALPPQLPRRTVPMRHITTIHHVPDYAIELSDLSHMSQLHRSNRASSSAPGKHPYAPLPRAPLSRVFASASTPTVEASVEPIIVAASWLGAKKRPFSKYKQLWNSLGYTNILAARPPMTSIMVPAAGQLYAANFTHKLIQHAKQHPTAPILVHLFSGGGFIFMGWVFQLLSQVQGGNDVLHRVQGVILDSSPADVTADVSSRALIAAALGRPADNIENELPWLVKPTTAVVDGYLKLPFIKDALVSMEDTWLSQAPACPKLFLYSDADAVTGSGVVEQFMQQQQAQGAQTYSYKWQDSAHVDHYRRYPEEYKQQLSKFVHKVLGQEAAAPAAVAAAAAAAGDDQV